MSVFKLFPVIALGLIVVWAAFSQESSPTSPPSGPAAMSGASIKGVRASMRRGGLLLLEAEAEDFKIVPKNFFVFRIKSINEAILSNTRMRIYLNNIEGYGPNSQKVAIDEDPIFSFLKEFTDKKAEAGVITKFIVEGIDIDICSSAGWTRLRAPRADFAEKEKRVFYDATLETSRLKKIIRAEEIIWDVREKKIKIPGRYITSTPQGDIKAKGLQIDLNPGRST